MNRFDHSIHALTPTAVCAIEETVGYRFSNRGLLTQAFTRSSYRNEHPDCPDNEVLEFIGDSVLSLTVITYFKNTYAEVTARGLITAWNEGEFSKLKSDLVKKTQLASCMEQLGLQEYLLVSRGDAKGNIRHEPSVMEDLFESIIGAIYVDSGENFHVTSEIVRSMLDIGQIVESCKKGLHISFQNDLQEWCQSKTRRFAPPHYAEQQLSENHFRVTTSVREIGFSESAEAQNLKLARECAAEKLLKRIQSYPATHFDPPPKQTVNFVGELMELAQKHAVPAPVYLDVSDCILPDNSHVFTVEVRAFGLRAEGTGSSKKEARHAAAKELLNQLRSNQKATKFF